MSRFIEGQERHQITLLPESLDEFVAEDSTVRVVDALSMNWIWLRWVLTARRQHPSGVRRTTRRCC